MPVIKSDLEMIWDDDAEQKFNEATDCYICNKPLDHDQNIISREHCHFSFQTFMNIGTDVRRLYCFCICVNI